jgi:AcrR family transcriptional regulator
VPPRPRTDPGARGARKARPGRPTTGRVGGGARSRARAESAAAQGADRRSDLLEAAYDLLAEKGLEGLRTRDIAARAGVNISTLHYYFGTKEALMLAVVTRLGQDFDAQNRALSTTETLLEHLDAGWKRFQDDPRLAAVLQELSLRARREPEGSVALRALQAFWNSMVENILRREVQAGRVRGDIDVALGARMVTSLVMGATTQLGIDPRAFDFREAMRELVRWLTPASP